MPLCSSSSATAVKESPATAPEAAPAASMAKHTIVFLRHGQSQWNLENKFTGWVDVPLSELGLIEAKEGGKCMAEAGLKFDKAYTSVLKRAIKTCNIALEELDQEFIPVVKDYRLNERMYGALAGLNKVETVEKHGKEQVHIWRRSYDIPPPEAGEDHEYHPSKSPWASTIPADKIPKTESLKLTLERVLPYWNDVIVPDAKGGKTLLIAAHGNSIRAIVKHLDNIPDDVISGIDIPTGVPLLYEFDADMNPIQLEGHAESLSGRYLIDNETLQKKIEEVKNQTKAK